MKCPTRKRPEFEPYQRPGRVGNRRRGDDRGAKSYLHTLAQEAHEKVDDDLTKAEASKEIDRLKTKTGRGQPAERKRKPR